MRLSFCLVPVLALISGATASAAPPPFALNPKGGEVSDERTNFGVHDKVHIKNELRQLHDDAVAMQRGDGGKLSEAHRATLEQRLAVLRKEACAVGLAGC